MFKAGRYRLHAAWPAITSCGWCLSELSDGEHVAFAVLEPGRLTDGGNRDAIYGAKARLVVLLELNPPGAELCNLSLQVLDDPGRELVLGGPGASGREQQEQTVLAAAVEECRSLFLASGESELVRIPGPGPRQVPGRDRRKHMPTAQHATHRLSFRLRRHGNVSVCCQRLLPRTGWRGCAALFAAVFVGSG